MDKEALLNYLMLFGIILIVTASSLVLHEFLGAKRFCRSIDGEYLFKVFPLPLEHLCNGKVIARYSDAANETIWDFEDYRAFNSTIYIKNN